MATMLPGVLPSIILASSPTASTFPVVVSIATTDGSLRTIPLFFTYTSTDAVPKSIPISGAIIYLLNNLSFLKLNTFFNFVNLRAKHG